MTTEIILSVVATIASGGWFINWKQNRRKATAEADESEGRAAAMKIDFIDQIFEKYQKTVLEAMGGHEEKHRQLDMDMKYIKRELSNISTFLNGEYKKHKRDHAISYNFKTSEIEESEPQPKKQTKKQTKK